MEVGDFNSLIASSQEHQVPVYSLTTTQLSQSGLVLAQSQQSMKSFRDAFDKCAEYLIALAK